MNKLNYIVSISIHVLVIALVIYFAKISTTSVEEDDLARADTMQVMLVQPISVPQEVKTNAIKDTQVDNQPIIPDAAINVSDKIKKDVEKTQTKAKVEDVVDKNIRKVENVKEKPKEISNKGSLDELKDKTNAPISQKGVKGGSSVSGNSSVAGYSDSVVRLLQPQVITAQLGQQFDPNLVVVVKVVLSQDAVVQRVKIVKSSKNLDFDQLVITVVNGSPQFPKFPSDAVYEKYKELTLTFKAE